MKREYEAADDELEEFVGKLYFAVMALAAWVCMALTLVK